MIISRALSSLKKQTYSPLRFSMIGINHSLQAAPPDKTDNGSEKSRPEKTEKTENAPSEKKDGIQLSKDIKEEGTSEPFISLGLDSSKPGAPDKAEENNRFPDRGRDIFIPVLKFGKNGPVITSPLPATGLDTNKDGLILKGPKTNAMDNFNSIDAPSQAVAALFDHLSEKYPNLEESVLWRLAKVGTYVAIDVPLMVASHEMGHGGAAMDACPGCSPNVVMTGWMSGYTSYNIPKESADEITPQERLFMSVAGMNQATFNGEEINRRMHTQGADVADAVQYLANITNSVNYQMKDWIKNSEPGFNDAATYHATLEAREKGWNQENLSMLALGVNLLNADFWASLVGTVGYIATGKQVKMPELEIGKAHISMPHFSLMNTYEGPQLNVSMYGHLNSKETLELKYSQILTPDNGPAFGVEGRLHNLDIPGTKNQLTFSPRAGISVHNSSVGYKIGAGIDFRPANNPNFALTAGLDYRSNYLPDQTVPGMSGLQGNAGMKFNF